MSRYDASRLYDLLPAVYRRRDEEEGWPLRRLVEILAEQAQIVEQDIEQLYQSWFIETCPPWVVPYIGDLLGVRGTGDTRLSTRAEVANTLAYRRRKGTAAVVEQLARDVTGWPARAVEFFELLGTTQHLNHLRPGNHRTPDLRDAGRLDLLGGPFDTIAHTADVRRISSRRGRYNVPNLGIFLWRLRPFHLKRVEAKRLSADGRLYTFNALGLDEPLFAAPRAEEAIEHIAREIHVPAPIRRRALVETPGSYFGEATEGGLAIRVGGELKELVACDLTSWPRSVPAGKVAVDPVRGRFAFPEGDAPGEPILVSYRYGFSDEIGAGPYPASSLPPPASGAAIQKVAGASALAEALDEMEPDSPLTIEIQDSATYTLDEVPAIPAAGVLEIRAAAGQRPTLRLPRIDGGSDSVLILRGLLLASPLAAAVGRLFLDRCTLWPGHAALSTTARESVVDRSILGAMEAGPASRVAVRDSILDAGDPEAAAVAGSESLTLSRCTIVGTVDVRELTLVESSILLGETRAERRQAGCVRFSWLTPGSRVPHRFLCLPSASAPEIEPRFTSLRFGDPGYCQLAGDCPEEIRRGAEDESEMGVFSSLKQPQREAALRDRLDEYLRAGLEAGIFYIT